MNFSTDSPSDQDGGISIILNGEESELKFEIDGKGNKVISTSALEFDYLMIMSFFSASSL